MVASIRSPKDFWTGVIYLGTGALGIVIGREYSFGTAGRMGPGYFPFVVSSLLIFLGVITLVRSFLTDGGPVGTFPWKAIALVVGSVVAFGLLLPTAGLIVAMVVMVLLSAAASEKFHFEWMATAALVALVVFCSLVFVKGLGVPMPLLGSWFGQ
jgi:uncharacterized membrane protein YhhN